MNIEEFREYCLQLPKVSESFPFDEDVLVFKVMNKMFALTSILDVEKGLFRIILKCEPEYAVELRGKYTEIQPGFHMNKKYWNSVDCDGELSDDFLKKLIKYFYDEVVKKLSKKLKADL